VILNRAAVELLRLTQPGEQTAGGRYEFIDGGATVTGNAAVYATIAKLPGLTEFADRLNSTRNFLRELNRFGLTQAIRPAIYDGDTPRAERAGSPGCGGQQSRGDQRARRPLVWFRTGERGA